MRSREKLDMYLFTGTIGNTESLRAVLMDLLSLDNEILDAPARNTIIQIVSSPERQSGPDDPLAQRAFVYWKMYKENTNN